MPITPQRISSERQDFTGSLTSEEIAWLADDRSLRVIQTSSNTDEITWMRLNEELFRSRPDIELRVYGFYQSICDLSFLAHMKHVQNFSADCLMNVTGIEHICELESLRSLSVGAYNLETFDFLNSLQAQNVCKLFIHRTKSKRPSLKVLENFKNLKTLYIEGQQKNLEAISTLRHLVDLTLRSVSPSGLDFIRPLKSLRSLDVKLGGIKNFSALSGLSQIQYLELWQIRGLFDLSVISSLTGLQFLFLQALKNVEVFPNLDKLKMLRRIYLEDMQGLSNLSAISAAPALEEFIHVSAGHMEPSDYESILRMRSLKSISVGFGSGRKNDAFRQLAARHNIQTYHHSDFKYAEP